MKNMRKRMRKKWNNVLKVETDAIKKLKLVDLSETIHLNEA